MSAAGGTSGDRAGRLAFDAAAKVYDEVRPSYPAALFDALFALLPPAPDILEVGPGTGQATADLLARGATVHAVELGPALAAVLRSKLPSELLSVSVGDFERLPLPARSVDAVFSATAYHWISLGAQLDRPALLLRNGGVLAVVDLIQVASQDDRGFFAAAQPLYDRYGQGHTGPPAPTREDADPPIRSAIASDRRFDRVEVRRYDWNQTYSAADYRKLMLSYSGTRLMPSEQREGLLDDVETLIVDAFDGRVTRPLVATLTTAILA
ncbi:class I SAM-dependent methyltransferase [Leifsonia sp. NPDC102414]|uniref:class I SAM-dependent methyltransferase n=1 Tax=Leifsonia sp. NPDC102414 TaxID=3364124 RepID=UPI0038250E3B